jgi:hypothetical protein
MDCSATFFIDDFSNFFIIFCRFAGASRPERSSSSADTQLVLKRECHSKTVIWLEECSLKASRSISRVSVADLQSFTQNLMQTCCPTLPSIADKTKQEVDKALM